MEVKRAESTVEKPFIRTRETQHETAVDHPSLATIPSPDPIELQNVGERIGRLVAQARALILQLLQTAPGPNSSMSQATRKQSSAYGPTAAHLEVAEVTLDRSPAFTKRDLSTVFCVDLDKFSLEATAQWIMDASKNSKPLPQIIVVGPRRRLSNVELKCISENIAPTAVFLRRPSTAASFDEVLRVVREKIDSAVEPERLTMEPGIDAVGEARELVVPGA